MKDIGAAAGGGEEFYAALPAIDDFDAFTDFAAYAAVPDDWLVIAADVTASTGAIAAGRYREVNTVGAAVITAVLNAAGHAELPFVFGGDGGAVLVPPRLEGVAAEAVRGVQRMADEVYDLPLRAAAVPLSRLRAEGHDIRVCKLRLSAGNHLALFAGGGIERADRIVKEDPGTDPHILAPHEGTAPPDLEGLTCRWEPLVPRFGRVIALIVRPCDPARPAPALKRVLTGISRILAQPIAGHAPVSEEALRLRFPPPRLGLEVRAATARGASRARAWGQAVLSATVQAVAERLRVRVGPYDPRRYHEEMERNTDYRKYDGALRVVLDVTPGEAGAIEALLEAEHRAGRVVFGMHVAERGLMTCLVFSLERSEHVHFVDADGGGFARAAEALKRRQRQTRPGA